MNRSQAIRAAVLILLPAWVATGCTGSYDDYKQYRQGKEARDATAPFTPTYYKDPQRRHLAVYFEISDGQLQPSTRRAELRPGNPPYRSPTAGNVLLVYRDAEGKELGRYATQDPVLARSCDSDRGLVGELKPLPNGMLVEVLLPADARIRSVEIGRMGQKPKMFPIGRQIDEGMQAKPATAGSRPD